MTSLDCAMRALGLVRHCGGSAPHALTGLALFGPCSAFIRQRYWARPSSERMCHGKRLVSVGVRIRKEHRCRDVAEA